MAWAPGRDGHGIKSVGRRKSGPLVVGRYWAGKGSPGNVVQFTDGQRYMIGHLGLVGEEKRPRWHGAELHRPPATA